MNKLSIGLITFLFLIVGSQRSFSQDTAKLKGTEEVQNLVNQSCPSDIPLVQQSPRGTFTKGKLCFEFDASGNYIGLKDCNNSVAQRSSMRIQTEEDLENQEEVRELSLDKIKSYIKIYPNPTEGVFQVIFEEEIYGKIGKVDVLSPNGGIIRTKTLLPGENSTTFTIDGYPSGLYVLKFTLHTNDFINANLIKK